MIALLAAGALAAALSTAAGLLLVISSAVSHDLLKKMVMPNISDKGELIAARIAATGAVCLAGYFGINPPGFVAATVALAFGLAASSFFPAILLGIFSKRINKEGAISGMLVGVTLMLFYMLKFKFGWFGEAPRPIGGLGFRPKAIFYRNDSNVIHIRQFCLDMRLLDDPQDIKTYHLGSILSGGGAVPKNNTPEGWLEMVNGFQKIAMEDRLAIPLIYGIDAVHGHNNVLGATVFPQNLALELQMMQT